MSEQKIPQGYKQTEVGVIPEDWLVEPLENFTSFISYGLTSATADSYLAALDSKTVGWTGAPNKIAAIQYQRLVCLNLTRPVETYINYLKTGYPDTPLALTATHANKPYRLVYPQSEYVGNSANVPNVTTNDVFVKNNFTPFWNRN